VKLLVTGGLGFIGSNYIRRVLDGTLQGISKVKVLDKKTYAADLNNFSKNELKELEIIYGDICDRSTVEKSIDGIDSVINFAAESHVDRSIVNPDSFLKTNIFGTSVLLECALKSKVGNFVQVSTDEVYGSIDSGSSKEGDSLNPSSPYSASKSASDLICNAFVKTYGLNIKITRSSNNYGPFQYPEKLIPLFIVKLLNKEKLTLYGSGNNVRSWLHVDDNCQGIHKVLMNGEQGEIYNLGGGLEMTNFQVTKNILKYFDKDESSIIYTSDRKAHDYRYSMNYEKAKNKLQFQPMVNFIDGLTQTIDWYINAQRWWSGKV
jgi:dTDP-glucose 4,6-dehydratase